MLLVLVIPAALVFIYGRMTGNRRQGYAIYGAMMVMFLGAVVVAYIAEAHGSPAQHAAGLHTQVISGSTGGNLEGKEQRFGIAGSALFDVITTVTSCGAVNSAIESFTGIGGAVPFANLSACRGDLRRRRHGPVLDPSVCPAGGVHRWADGRTDAGVARQEARGQRDQARRPGHPDHAAGGAVLHGAGHREQGRARVDLRRGPSPSRAATRRRPSRRPSTPTSPRRTTTARRSPATRASSSRTPATSAPTASPSPTCSAAST